MSSDAEAALSATEDEFVRTHGGKNPDDWFSVNQPVEPEFGHAVHARAGGDGHLTFVQENGLFIGAYIPFTPGRNATISGEHVYMCVTFGKSAAEAKFRPVSASADQWNWIPLSGRFGCLEHHCLLFVMLVFDSSNLCVVVFLSQTSATKTLASRWHARRKGCLWARFPRACQARQWGSV